MRYFQSERRITKALLAIERDDKSGARELALRALRLLRDARPAAGVSKRSYVAAVRRLGLRAERARPSMAPVGGVVARVIHDFLRGSRRAAGPQEAYAVLVAWATAVEEELTHAHRAVTEHFRKRFARIRRPMVISYSSQVIALLRSFRPTCVTVCESRPAFEGRRTARLLQGYARTVRVITEAQVSMLMRDCDGVVLGCDTIYSDGAVLNKTGSSIVALAARRHRRPVIVVGDRFKVGSPRGAAREVHRRSEIWKGAPSTIEIENVYFEKVPNDLVDWIVLDDGVHRPGEMKSKWAVARRHRAALRARA
jgi:translation initiation factor 2B subunit (eIF-2B alpha/beta/delta family)